MIRKHHLAFLLAPAFLLACREAPTTPAAVPEDANALAAFAMQAAPEQVMEGEVLVKLQDSTEVDAVAREHGLARGLAGRDNAFYVMHGQAGNEHGKAAELRQDARVVFAEPNFLREPTE